MSITNLPDNIAINEKAKTVLKSYHLQTELTLDQLDSVFRQQKRTGRLVIHYHKGGKSMLFFEELQNL